MLVPASIGFMSGIHGCGYHGPCSIDHRHSTLGIERWRGALQRNLAKASTNGADLCAVATTNLAGWAFRSSFHACYVFVVSTGGAGAHFHLIY